jgi:arylsulfatase A-like enzyme
MKRIYIHALALFVLAFAYTKGTILSVFMHYIPLFAQIMIVGCFLVFLVFLAWIKRYEDHQSKRISWKSILKIAVLGSFCGYILQLINIFVYLKIRAIPIDIGLFEDEFYRSIVFIFPCLVVAELLYHFLKNSWSKQLILTALVVALCGFQLRSLLSIENPKTYPLVSKTTKDKPNVIVILADDLGTGDVSFNGQKKYNTPNIDRLAAEGINFKNAFCSAPICSPSRVGLLTGEYQQRYGFEHLTDGFSSHPYARKADFAKYGHQLGGDNTYWWDLEVAKRGIDPQTTTLAEFLKEDGYATAIIGKWHLGLLPRFQPANHGFDYFLGTYSAGMFYLSPNDARIKEYFHPDNFFEKLEHQLMVYKLFENGKPLKLEKEVYTTDLFTERGLDFIEKNKDNRFFLYLPFNAVHGPFQAPKRIYDTLTRMGNHEDRVYAAMVTSLDESVGLIRKKLDDLHLDDNTIIVFASDNGAPLYFPAGTNAPLYGGKMSGFEGGLRVPFVFHWKNHIKPTAYPAQVSLMDVFKTVAAAIGKDVPKNVAQDGVNLLPFATSTDTLSTPHKALFWRVGYVKAVRKGDWKLNINEKEGFTLLHNLKEDPYETRNLASIHLEKVEELKKDLANWEKELKKPNWRQSLDAKVEDGKGKRFYFPW